MALCVRHRFLEVLIRIRVVPQRTALETGQLSVMAVVEDGLAITISAPSLQTALSRFGETAQCSTAGKKTYEILPVRREIVRQPFPAQAVDDRVGRKGTGALFAVRHERLPRLRHLRDGVLGGSVLRFDELIARDGAGVVVGVGFLEVFVVGYQPVTSLDWSKEREREREGKSRRKGQIRLGE